MWSDARGWDMNRIEPYVQVETKLELFAIIVDTNTRAHDRLSWGGTMDGKFTVSSAYTLLTWEDVPRVDMGRFYDQVWGVKAPERVKVFLWLVSHQVLMTNQERFRRHLSGTEVCEVCKGGVETTLHILRDCPAMERIWQRLIPRRMRHSFFQQSLLEWLFINISDHKEENGVPWATTFVLGIWWGWKWRCANVFGGNKLCRDRLKVIKDMGKEVVSADEKWRVRSERRERVEIMVSWKVPRAGEFKLNTDGASHGNPGLATAGGVIRNAQGEWCGGFALNIGRCSAPLAELWGVYYGLGVAWNKRIDHLELEVDSKIVVEFLTRGIGDSHPLSFLVRKCHGLILKDWSVRVSHVHREANRLADELANYAFSLPFGFHLLDTAPTDVALILAEDVSGLSYPRQAYL